MRSNRSSAISLIGLAKKEETIVFPDERRIESGFTRTCITPFATDIDEAHRFANQFNADLRVGK